MCIFSFLITHVFVVVVVGFFFINAWCFLSYYSKKFIRNVIRKLHKEIEDIHKVMPNHVPFFFIFTLPISSSLCTCLLTPPNLPTYLPTYLLKSHIHLLNVLTYQLRYLSTYAIYPPTQYTYLSTYLGSQHALLLT
jgi:hypothetical protein